MQMGDTKLCGDKNCICHVFKEIDPFYSSTEYEVFQEYLDELLSKEILKWVRVDGTVGSYRQAWYRCKQCSRVWGLVYPTATHRGRFYLVKEAESLGAVSYLTYVSAITNVGWGQCVTAQITITVTNTGEVPLLLNSAAYDIEDINGRIIATSSTIRAFPQIIKSGESGYYFDITRIDRWDKSASFTVLPRPQVFPTRLNAVRLEVPEFYLGDRSSYGLNVLGRVKNTTDSTHGQIKIAALLFDQKEQPLGIINSDISEQVPPGVRVGFSSSSESILQLRYKDVARYEVFAFPHQRRDEE